MDLTVKKLRSRLKGGGVWILLVNRKEMGTVIKALEKENDYSLHKMHCETIDDAVKASLLIDAFNSWTVAGIREFMNEHKNFPKIREEEY